MLERPKQSQAGWLGGNGVLHEGEKSRPLCLGDLSRLDAARADTNPLGGSVDLCLDWPKIHIPAALAHVVSVGDFIAELRTLAADFAELSHNKLHRS